MEKQSPHTRCVSSEWIVGFHTMKSVLLAPVCWYHSAVSLMGEAAHPRPPCIAREGRRLSVYRVAVILLPCSDALGTTAVLSSGGAVTVSGARYVADAAKVGPVAPPLSVAQRLEHLRLLVHLSRWGNQSCFQVLKISSLLSFFTQDVLKRPAAGVETGWETYHDSDM